MLEIGVEEFIFLRLGHLSLMLELKNVLLQTIQHLGLRYGMIAQ